MRRAKLFLTLVVFLLLVGSALAMVSTNYRLDWFTPLSVAAEGQPVLPTMPPISLSARRPAARSPARTMGAAWATGVEGRRGTISTCRWCCGIPDDWSVSRYAPTWA